MGANVLGEFENVFFNWGRFFKLGAKNYFGIEKISYFGNYMDPCSGDLISFIKLLVQGPILNGNLETNV